MNYIKKILQKRKNKADFNKAMEIIKHVNTLVTAGAMFFNRKDREVLILKEIFWEGKTPTWKQNFCNNMALFMDIEIDHPVTKPIKIFSMKIETKEKNELLIEFEPKPNPKAF